MALNFAYCHNFITFYTQTLQILIIGNDKTIRHNSICPDASRDILGDKLTAFAPHTSGIQFFKKERNCSLEIIKQMFDVAALFDICHDFQQTNVTFRKFGETELGYRKKEGTTTNDILKDAINTALCVSLRGFLNEEEFVLLQGGIKRIGGLILSERYHLDSAIRDSAKAAYVAAIIMTQATEVYRYENTPIEEWKNAVIDQVLSNKLNKLKKSNPEAFFYWWQVDKLLAESLQTSYYNSSNR